MLVLPKGKTLLPFSKSSSLFRGVCKDAKETEKALKAITGNGLCCYNNGRQLLMSHQILNVVKKFRCHDDRMQFLFSGADTFAFFPLVLEQQPGLGFWSGKYLTDTSRK